METPFDAFQAINNASNGTTLYAPGLQSVKDNSTALFAAAEATAKLADTIVLMLGLDLSIEREGLDRHSITLPGAQEALFQLLMATGKPLVVVLLNGGAVAIDSIKYSNAAVVEAFYPGFYGSRAIASAVFGLTNSWGKLPITIFDRCLNFPHPDTLTALLSPQMHLNLFPMFFNPTPQVIPLALPIYYNPFQGYFDRPPQIL